MNERRPVSELVDLTALGSARDGSSRSPSPAEIRAGLPPGWVLEEDGLHARRDARVFFRDSWILLGALVAFGTIGLGFLWGAMPRGWAGVLRLGLLLTALLVIGGVVGPLISRALQRKA